MRGNDEASWRDWAQGGMSDPAEIARTMGRQHQVLQEVLARQEALLQSLSDALEPPVLEAEPLRASGSKDPGEVLGAVQEDDDENFYPKIDGEEDEGEADAPSWPWPSGRPEIRARPKLKRSKRESILAPGAVFSSSPSTASMHAVLKKRTLSSSVLMAKAQDSKIPFLRCFLEKLVAISSWFSELKEPERTSCFSRIVDGHKFSTLCLLVILANAILIIIVSDYEIQHLGESIPEDWEVLELSLTIFYGVELMLKILVHRLYFFVNEEWRWNIFDFFLVVFSFSEVAISRYLVLNQTSEESSASLNVGFLRLLRLTKLAKVLRVFRTLKFFTELRLMIDCVLGSFMQIFWCLVMIVFVLYVFSLLLVQGIADYMLTAENLTDKHRTELLDMFGSVGGALMTLFQSTTAGLDWRTAFDPLLQAEGNPFLASVFLVYISIFTISIWNIVTSTFVEKAMKLAKPDLDSMLLEQSLRDLQDSDELEKLFKPYASRNEAGEDEIALDDLQEAADEAEFLLYLSVRGIDVKNVKLFFYMLGSMREDNVIDLKSLVKACVRMKGFATSIDLQSVSFEAKLMHGQVKEMLEALAKRLDRMEVRSRRRSPDLRILRDFAIEQASL
ncbi:Sodium channel protein type 10 subunit alpha (Peripheral nerve sodium channel 3) (PN3) (Sensory neuron sodium channel) (Sodium channel protein type X subunit alpha) (Voltage-gated sodium channel subunit alpha Nav1.8) [Durusdinium trenchii]|uniref:Ion transport domain-containing protein n=1 Tax=Durusdinium trenchii TaxID=1381693 RepID=A0ABP0MHH7_9DINO